MDKTNNMPCFSCGCYRPDFDTMGIGCLGSKNRMSGNCDLYNYDGRKVRTDILMLTMQYEEELAQYIQEMDNKAWEYFKTGKLGG
jgi:hypothetical protein